MKYLVRVTRSSDEEWADVPVEADDWEKAKKKAIAEVILDPNKWFGDPPMPRYYVAYMDDDEEASMEE